MNEYANVLVVFVVACSDKVVDMYNGWYACGGRRFVLYKQLIINKCAQKRTSKKAYL
jgi:hypothetical protein